MTYFLDFRTRDVGGAVTEPRLFEGDGGAPQASWSYVADARILSVVAGADILFATHGFNVSRANGAASLGSLDRYLGLVSPGLFIGMLWPGDAWLPIVDYPFEGDVAIDCGDRLAHFCNRFCTGARSLSFLSHSLGARLVLQAIAGLDRRAQSACLTAAAINRDCFLSEYGRAASNCDAVSVLASHNDAVLTIAFSIGDPLSDLLHDDHVPFQSALGYDGPPRSQSQPVARPWQIPDYLDYGHGDYLPPSGPASLPPPADACWPRAADFMKRAFLGQPQNWPPS